MMWSNSKRFRFARIGSHVVDFKGRKMLNCQTPQTGLCEFLLISNCKSLESVVLVRLCSKQGRF